MPAGKMFMVPAKQRKVPDNVKRYVRSQVRKENENLDFLSSVTAEDAAYDTESMNDLTGLAVIAGSRARIVELDMAYHLFTVAATEAVCRVIIFQWYGDDNVDVPTLEDVLGNTGSATSIIDRYDKESETGHLMKVLYDRNHILGKNTALDGSDHAVGKFRITNSRCPRKYIKGTNSAKGFNKIYCLALSDQATGANAPHIEIQSRLLYELVQQN